jgi:DNA-binding NtrC family response regulator
LTSSSVLIVDDEPLIRWSLKTHLEQAGFDVVDAESGRQALDRFGDAIGLALVDLRLPDTNGLQLLGELKRRKPKCRIILMTAYGTPEVTREALDSGAYQVLDKPFNLERLTGRSVAGSPSKAARRASRPWRTCQRDRGSRFRAPRARGGWNWPTPWPRSNIGRSSIARS